MIEARLRFAVVLDAVTGCVCAAISVSAGWEFCCHLCAAISVPVLLPV